MQSHSLSPTLAPKPVSVNAFLRRVCSTAVIASTVAATSMMTLSAARLCEALNTHPAFARAASALPTNFAQDTNAQPAEANVTTTQADDAKAADACTALSQSNSLAWVTATLTPAAVRHLGRINDLRSITMKTDVADVDESLRVLFSKDSPVKGIEMLTMRNSRVTDAGLAWMSHAHAPLTQLKVLSLSNTKITDQGVASLAGTDTPLKALERLILSNTKITDQSLAVVARKDSPFIALTALYLDGTEITNHGIAKLAHKDSPLTSLAYLNFSRTTITDDGLALLAAKDSPLTAITTLDLSHTAITDNGLAHLIAENSPFKSLTMLYVRDSKITNEGLAAVKRRIPKIKIVE